MSDESARTINGRFATREAADRAIEHLTQEHGINRGDVFVQAIGSRNTSGATPSGGDAPSRDSETIRADAPTEGELEVSADVREQDLPAARRAFEEAGAVHVTVS
ncbi:hypothetical protein [Rhizobium halophilum]|uniref:hypothetical protein n=1 Tax=Rhizobium halophilum TaxID=2846852 RepID=UPI001EFDF4F2|nr:hypothetical protein [Rhizobium halophilum]MCF6370779.1 hypothetical protein [Rhizobium halophilum]